jgi:hypothetical protein
MEGFVPASLSHQRTARPFGLWIAATCNVIFALWLARGPLFVLSVLYNPEPADIVLHPWAEPMAWIGLGIALGICAASVRFVAGSRAARNIALVLLTIIAVTGIHDSVFFAIWYRSAGYHLSDLNWAAFWNGGIGLWTTAWLAINGWLLWSARQFFAD